MEADGVALALEHGALQVVVEDDPRRRAEEAEGLDVPPQEARHRRTHREVDKAEAAVREHHHEGEEIAHGASHGELAEMRPVDLSLLAGQHRTPQVRLRVSPRTEATDDGAKRAPRARVAALLHH